MFECEIFNNIIYVCVIVYIFIKWLNVIIFLFVAKYIFNLFNKNNKFHEIHS